jgi:hypothetical protein
MIVRTFPIARQQHRCTAKPGGPHTSTCGGDIPAGTRYLKSSLTPHDSSIGNVDWRTMRICRTCAAYYGHPVPELVSAR